MKGEKLLMKKKTLIVPVVAAMLAVSCGSAPTVRDWSEDVKSFMSEKLGEVLPFLALDEASTVIGYEADEFGGYFSAYDDNATNLVEAYGQKLVDEAKFVFDQDSGAYYKENELSTIQVALSYYDAQSGVTPGNEINVNFMYNESPEIGDWSADVKTKMQSMFGMVFPYASIDKGEIFRFGTSTEVEFYMFGEVESNKCVTYLTRLTQVGFEIYVDESYNYYALAQVGDNTVKVEVAYLDEEEAAKYGYTSALNEIDISFTSLKKDSFPAVETKSGIEYYAEEEVPVPDFTAQAEGVFYYYEQQIMELFEGFEVLYLDTYAYGVTSAELAQYARTLIGQGWVLSYYDGTDYSLMYPNSYMLVDLIDHSESVDPKDPYTAQFSFYSYFSDNGDFENEDVATTLAFLLQLPAESIVAPAEETDTTYYVVTSYSEATVEQVVPYISSAISYSGYYFFNQDLSSVEYEDPEAEEKVVKACKYYFLTDGWTEDNNGQYIYLEVSKDAEVAGKVNVSIKIAGNPVEKIWTPLDVLEKLVADTAIGSSLGFASKDIHDLGDGQYVLSAYRWPSEYAQLIVNIVMSSIQSGLRDFSTEQTEFLTREVEIEGETYTVYYVVYTWTSRDGSKTVALNFNYFIDGDGMINPALSAYEIAANPEAPETGE